MNIRKDIKVDGKHGRPILIDTYNLSEAKNLPIIIWVHGFKGFKDWGHWPLVGEAFAKAGFFFVSFNFSFNGTTPEAPLEFGDLEAFGMNNYTKELDDIGSVMDWLERENHSEYDLDKITLIGHSRGGGVSIIKAYHDPRVKKLITWASVNSLGYASNNPELLEKWKEKGVWYIMNGRTKQEMPLYYQLHEDITKNKDKYDVEKATKNFSKPWLLIHGTEDPAVPLTAGLKLKEWNQNIQLEIMEDANHVFGGKHPYSSDELPIHSRQLLSLCINFLS